MRGNSILGQVIGWFSAGVTSAVAIKFAMDHGLNVLPIYFETGSAHPDNARFLRDCEKWYGTKILTLRNPKYSNVLDLVNKTGYFNGPNGAHCTLALKKEIRYALEKWTPYEAQVFGFEYERSEVKRAQRFIEQYPQAKAIFPLIEGKLTKPNCIYELARAGIELPEMYKLGYHNNNCIGCVKGGMGYWNKIRQDFPETFHKMAKLEREKKHSCIKGVYLDELDPNRGKYPSEIAPECGIYCPVESD